MKHLILALALAFLFISCKKDAEGVVEGTVEGSSEADTELRDGANFIFASVSTIKKEEFPENKIELGMKLFYDKRLSVNDEVSCNSCHDLANFGVDGKAKSPGFDGTLGGRNSPTVIYASLHNTQFWDGRAADVEEQAGGPILNPVEHGIPSEQFLEEKLRGIEEYQKMFKEVYPNDEQPITFSNIQSAIGAFERQLSPKSRFDDFLDGNDDALTADEKAGLKSFMDNKCTVCHYGITVGGQMFQKFGLYGDYWELTKSAMQDAGRADITNDSTDMFVFKVPGLRNVTKTSPYFHDGSVSDLKEAVKIMQKLQNDKDMSDEEAGQIIAFFGALESDVDPKYKQD